MKIKEITISNWRSIKNLKISFQDLMIFIGQNNHGKLNILSAILFFFGEQKHQELDFNEGSSELFVEIVFSDLTPKEKETFNKYITEENCIKIRKTAYLSGGFEYKGYIQSPTELWLQEKNASNYTKREIAIMLPFKDYLPDGRLSKDAVIKAQQEYMKNQNNITFDYEIEDSSLLGAKSLPKNIFGYIYFIPAVKDTTDDFSSKDSSAFGKLYSQVIENLSKENTAWKDTKETFVKLFSALNKNDINGDYNQERPSNLIELEEKLNNQLKDWMTEIDIEVTPPEIGDIFKTNTRIWVNDGVKTDIKRKGHGLQRALIFSLIKIIANDLKEENIATSNYFILEEPELYLHPQAQRSLFDSLVKLSESSQVMLCTHSSAFIDIEKYSSICIVRKDSQEDGTKIKQVTDDVFIKDEKNEFNLQYYINPDRSELFFAKKVILLEGQTDKTVIPFLAKKLNVFKYDYTLIDCGSKATIPLYIKLLNKFFISYIAVYDRDNQVGKSSQALDTANRDTCFIEDEIISSLGKSVVFINDIEEEIGFSDEQKKAKSKPFVALSHIRNEEYLIPESLKNHIISIYS